MPLRNDSSLWYNLPGVVAAYQPVRAPDSLLARYNMACGGTNAYRAEPGVLPAWSGAGGWRFNGTTQYLDSKVIVPISSVWTLMVQFFNVTGGQVPIYYLARGPIGGGFIGLSPQPFNSARYYGNGNYTAVSPAIYRGNMCVAGLNGYLDGRLDAAILSSSLSETTRTVYLGAANADVATFHIAANITGVAFFNRTLSPAEVWTASRQMQYCDVNPDWSVWSPRRKWFPYVLAGTAAGRVGIYGARPTVALPGGVRIVPQDEGGING